MYLCDHQHERAALKCPVCAPYKSYTCICVYITLMHWARIFLNLQLNRATGGELINKEDIKGKVGQLISCWCGNIPSTFIAYGLMPVQG